MQILLSPSYNIIISVVTSNEVQYLSKSTSIWEFFYLSKSKSTLKKVT